MSESRQMAYNTIKGAEFEALKRGCFDTLKAHNLHPFMVQNFRHAWECFHKAVDEGRIDLNALYRTYNDTHIETALNKIFRDVLKRGPQAPLV